MGPGVGHGEREGLVLQVVSQLVFELVSPDRGATRAIAVRVTGLDHEAFDHAMEDMRVVVAVAAVSHEVFNCLGAVLRVELQIDLSHGRVEDSLVRQGFCRRAQACLCVDILAGLLVKDVSPDALASFRLLLWVERLPLSEKIEPRLLVGRARKGRVDLCHLSALAAIADSGLGLLGALLRLPLVQSDL